MAKKAAKKRTRAEDSRLPFTRAMLAEWHAFERTSDNFDSKLRRVSGSLGYHGWLRISELCSDGKPNGVPGLRLKDITFNRNAIDLMVLGAKTDKEKKGAKITIVRSGEITCAVAAIEKYMEVRPPTRSDTRFLVHEDGREVMATWVREKLKDECRRQGRTGHFNCHSLRIGAASDGVRIGLTETEIKLRGRWRSEAFRRYIRPTSEQLGVKVAKMTKRDADRDDA